MTKFTDRELKRHEYLAGALLILALVLWSIAVWFRTRGLWVPEYPHTMLGLAAVLLFTSLLWRGLSFAHAFRHDVSAGNFVLRMLCYLAVYALCVIIGAVWLIYEQRNLPEIAWLHDHNASTIALYALLALILPYILTFASRTLLRKTKSSNA